MSAGLEIFSSPPSFPLNKQVEVASLQELCKIGSFDEAILAREGRRP
jgi:hypothetical protein